MLLNLLHVVIQFLKTIIKHNASVMHLIIKRVRYFKSFAVVVNVDGEYQIEIFDAKQYEFASLDQFPIDSKMNLLLQKPVHSSLYSVRHCVHEFM